MMAMRDMISAYSARPWRGSPLRIAAARAPEATGDRARRAAPLRELPNGPPTMFIAGNGVHGGKVYGQWPGLKSDQLYEGRDLAFTTDFRDVFGEIATRHLGSTEPKSIFPNYSLNHSRFKGFLS